MDNSFVNVSDIDSEKYVLKRKKPRLPRIQRTLAVVIASLQGERVVIELKDDSEISGVVDFVGSGMDVCLRDVRVVRPFQQPVESEFIQITGSSIRYVHIPPTIRMTSRMNDYIASIENTSAKCQPRKRKAES